MYCSEGDGHWNKKLYPVGWDLDDVQCAQNQRSGMPNGKCSDENEDLFKISNTKTGNQGQNKKLMIERFLGNDMFPS